MDAALRLESLSPVDARPGGMDHRWGRRIACGSEVRLADAAGQTGRGRMRDVSMSGAFIETPLPVPVHAALTVAVVRANGTEATLRAHVVRRDSSGFGVEWSEASHGSICPVLGCATPCAAAARWE